MAAQPSLEQLSSHRRSSTAHALRRGHIKISDPILLHNSGPSPAWKASSPAHNTFQHSTFHRQARSLPSDSVTDLKLFQGALVNAALPIGLDSNTRAASEKSPPSLTDSSLTMSANSTTPGEQYKMSESLVDNHPLRQQPSGFQRETKDIAVAQKHSDSNAPAGYMQHRPSTTGSMQDSGMDSPAKRKRRSGSIRKAFGRLFSKREKDVDSPTRAKISRHGHNASESAVQQSPIGILDEAYEGDSQNRPSPRISRAEQGKDRRSRSPVDNQPKHSLPFPMNIHGAQPASYSTKAAHEEEDLTSSQPPQSPHRRRATLPSIVLSPAEAAALSKYWDRGGAISVELESNDRGRTPTPLIGLAITSNTASRRRSRSADAMNELAAQHASDVRRRSTDAHLHPWRLADQRIPEVEEDDIHSPRSHHASIQDMPVLSTENEPRHSVTNEQLQPSESYESANEEPQEISSDQRESYGSENQHVQEVQSISSRVDKRLSQMELNIHQLEQSMQTLSGRQQSFTLQKAPRSRSGLPENKSRQERQHVLPLSPQHPTRSASARYPASPRITHTRPSPSLHDIGVHFGTAEEDEERFDTARAVPFYGASPAPTGSGTFASRRHTAREPPSTPPGPVHNFSTPYVLPKDSPTRIIDQLAPVYSALQYERAVRKQLEATVLQLQHDLLNLTTVVYEMRGLGAYPTPSPEYALGIHRDHRESKHADDELPEQAQEDMNEFEDEEEQHYEQRHIFTPPTDRWPSLVQSSSPTQESAYRRNF